MKNLLITGASKNLGKYLSEFFLKKNFNVIGVSKKVYHLKIGQIHIYVIFQTMKKL